jgi:uncharacterized protein (TIGR04255 family)
VGDCIFQQSFFKNKAKEGYSNPPIIEAVCEFRFRPETNWDLTVPGLIYEKVKERFKHKEQRILQEVSLTQIQNGVQQTLQTNERMMFLEEGRKRFIQIGQHILAVNCLRPYPGWKEYKQDITSTYSALNDVVPVKGFQRIGLRYINKIDIPKKRINIEDYFEYRPFLGKKLPQELDSFITQCWFSFYHGRDTCKLQITNAVPEKPETVSFILDLDYSLIKSEEVRVDSALDWVDEAHKNIEDVFEGCLTHKCRGLFKKGG